MGRLVQELRRRNMEEHAHLSRAEIHDRIRERQRQGKPVGRLISALRGRNVEEHSGLTETEIAERIIERQKKGKPVGRLISAFYALFGRWFEF